MYFAVITPYPHLMRIQFTKMIQFSLLVKAGDRLREFNFRKLNKEENGVFSVNVCDERGNRIFFNMEKQDGHWRIDPVSPAPKWLDQNPEGLHLALEEELKQWENN
jgi:hypothetical protein